MNNLPTIEQLKRIADPNDFGWMGIKAYDPAIKPARESEGYQDLYRHHVAETTVLLETCRGLAARCLELEEKLLKVRASLSPRNKYEIEKLLTHRGSNSDYINDLLWLLLERLELAPYTNHDNVTVADLAPGDRFRYEGELYTYFGVTSVGLPKKVANCRLHDRKSIMSEKSGFGRTLDSRTFPLDTLVTFVPPDENPFPS